MHPVIITLDKYRAAVYLRRFDERAPPCCQLPRGFAHAESGLDVLQGGSARGFPAATASGHSGNLKERCDGPEIVCRESAVQDHRRGLEYVVQPGRCSG